MSLEDFIINYKEQNNNIYLEIGKQQGDEMISTYKIELINIKKIYTKEYIWQLNKSTEENIKDKDNTSYKEISNLKEEIEKNNIILSTHISKMDKDLYSMDIFTDWSNKDYKILFQDYKIEIIKNISIH